MSQSIHVNQTHISQQQIISKLKQQICKIDNDIAHYTQKQQVQSKRLKYLKKQNQQLKHKKISTLQNSSQIKQQSQSLKQLNKSLKEQLKSIQYQLSQYDNNNWNLNKQVIIKDTIITNQTQQIDLPKCNITDIDIQNIKSFNNIKTLIMGQNQITDQGMKIITSNMIQIKKLFLNHNLITNNGLINISNLKLLKCLDLRCNQISDHGLQYIGRLRQLSQLSLSNNNISDNGVRYLLQLRELRYLDITSNKIGYEGGLMIVGLRQLTNLYLSHNNINKQCVQELIKKLRQLKVLDVRFNDIKGQQKIIIKQNKQNNQLLKSLQLFL